MIDTHCHVLFGVDDGARTLEESLLMIQEAMSHNITKILCTPHLIPGHRFEKNSYDVLMTNFVILKNKIEELNYPIEIYLGAEFQVSDAALDWIENRKVVTLNQTSRVLVELPWHYGGEITRSEDYYLQLMIDAGYDVIIAHPERYASVMDDFSTLKRWKAMGCAFQVNRTSLVQGESSSKKELAWRMVEEGYCDTIASDAHSYFGTRVNDLEDIYTILTEKYSKDLAEKLCHINPGRCITGEKFI